MKKYRDFVSVKELAEEYGVEYERMRRWMVKARVVRWEREVDRRTKWILKSDAERVLRMRPRRD